MRAPLLSREAATATFEAPALFVSKMVRLEKVTLPILLSLLLAGCFADSSPGALSEFPSPAEPQSAQPNLAAGANGQTYLSWIQVSDDGARRLRFAEAAGDAWSEVREINQDANLLVNWADFPSLVALDGGTLAAHWLTTQPGRGGYDVNIALSPDNGRTWGQPVTPHQDATPTEHGFVALSRNAGGGVDVLWLDSRKLEKAGVDDVSLMRTNVGLDGMPGAEQEIDPRVCECCAPSSTVLGQSTLVAYRDRSDDEIRDIAVIRFDGTQWTAPKIVAEDRWQIYACPINGPSIDSRGDTVAVAWYTSANDTPRVKIAFSNDGGITFGEAIQVDDGNPRGRVDVAVIESGSAVATWIEHSTEGGQVRARRIDADGTVRPSLIAGPTSVGNSSGFPRIQAGGAGAILAWTDTEEHRVRTARWQP